MEHTLVSEPGGSGLIGIDPGYDHDLICNFLLNGAQFRDIFKHRILSVCRTGTDHQNEFVAFAGENVLDRSVVFSFLKDRLV